MQGLAGAGRALLSQGNVSQLVQFSAGNVARVYMYEGSVQAPNRSVVEQNRIDPIDTRSTADIAIRGFGNESSVSQMGNEQFARVSMAGGGIGNDPSGRRLGNSSSLIQFGSLKGHSARLSIGSTSPGQGQGTINRVEQRGDHATISNDAILWQTGQFGSVSLFQRIRGAQDDGGAAADIAQSGAENSANVRQIGHHSVRVTQGVGRRSSIGITQYDSGGGPRAGVPDDGTRLYSPGAVFRGNNAVMAGQYGDANSMHVWQEGSDLDVTLWQKVGSSNNRASVIQGQRNVIFSQWFANESSSTVTQDGHFNGASIQQYGLRNHVTVEQLGTANAELRNSITARQVGADQQASIRQTKTAGPSAAGDPASGFDGDLRYFAGGARSTSAELFQNTNSASANIEQRGRGQLAIIDQYGSGQSASILQDVGATNATAIIYQEGESNSFSIVQTQPGQHLHVRQTGTNNSVNTVVQRGPGS